MLNQAVSKQVRQPGALKRFKCHVCGEYESVTGGTSLFLCSGCKDHRFTYGRHVRQSILTGREDAAAAVARAIRSGVLQHPSGMSCADCGGSATEYDHRNYSQPLEVDPVCRRCNLNRGPGVPVPGFFSNAIERKTVPYRLNKRARQLFQIIGADTAPLDGMPKTLDLDHWKTLLPLIQAAAPELERRPTKDTAHA